MKKIPEPFFWVALIVFALLQIGFWFAAGSFLQAGLTLACVGAGYLYLTGQTPLNIKVNEGVFMVAMILLGLQQLYFWYVTGIFLLLLVAVACAVLMYFYLKAEQQKPSTEQKK